MAILKRLAENGYIEKEVLENYLIIQKDFKYWVSSKIAFCDLDGDHYFKIHRKNHNLDRARTHIKLVTDMEEKMERMNEIVMSYYKR